MFGGPLFKSVNVLRKSNAFFFNAQSVYPGKWKNGLIQIIWIKVTISTLKGSFARDPSLATPLVSINVFQIENGIFLKKKKKEQENFSYIYFKIYAWPSWMIDFASCIWSQFNFEHINYHWILMWNYFCPFPVLQILPWFSRAEVNYPPQSRLY